jgi:carbonic anhydrase/acetyltransferase-like protein (isoleucine patch superfamily)
MLVRNRGAEPVMDSSAFVAPTVVLVGRVSVGPEARIMYGAVLDSEASKVEVGATAIVCENSVLRATSVGGADLPVVVGDHAFVGPHATLLGCVVEPACYLATGATVLQGATVGSGAVVAVGALVHANTKVPSEFFVPPQHDRRRRPPSGVRAGRRGTARSHKERQLCPDRLRGEDGVGGPHPEVQGDCRGQGGGVREPP